MKQTLHYLSRKILLLFSLLMLHLAFNQSATAQSCDMNTSIGNGTYTWIGPNCNWQTASDYVAAGNCKWYVIDLSPGYTYTFKTGCGDGATANFDTWLEVRNYNYQGNYDDLLFQNDDGCPDPYLTSYLSFTANNTGIVLLKVTSYQGLYSGNYTLAYQATQNLTASFTTNISGNTVDFIDASTGVVSSYSWDFGDGTTSNVQSPTHTYNCPGTYNVVQTITDAFGCSSQNPSTVTVSGALVAPSFTNTISGNVVTFTNASTGPITSYNWNFGDGISTSNAPSPVQTYTCAGRYFVSLTITDPNGCTSSYSDYVEAQGDPQARFSIASVTGTTVSFADASTGSQLTWNWDFGDGSTSTTQNPTHTYACPGDYTVRLVVGSFGPCTSREALANVTVNGNPKADFYAVSNGSTVTLTNTSTGNITGYSWDFGDGGTSTATNPTRTYACPGYYWVQLTATSANGCVNTIGRSVNVEGDPSASFTTSINGLTVDLTDNSTSSTALTYSWYISDGSSYTIQNPSHTFTCPGTYYAYLTVENLTGCRSSFYKEIVIVGNPNPGFISTVLPNLTVSFANTTTGTATSFYWEFGDNEYSTLATPTHVYDCPGEYAVRLTVSGNGCDVTTSQTVTLTGSPQADFTSSASGSTVTFTNASIGSNLTYSWNFGSGGGTSTDANPAYTYSCGGRKYVTLEVTSPSGCRSTTTRIVEVRTDPFADYTYSSSGTTFNFVSTSVGNITDYRWYINDPNFNFLYSTLQNPTLNFTECGDYRVGLYITNGVGCMDYYESTVTTPVTAVSISDTTLIAAASGATYQWIDCNNGNAPIPGQVGQNFQVGTNGNYAVIVTVGTCSDTSECTTVTSVGLNNPALQPKLSVYPNPSYNRFNVMTEGAGEFNLTIYDLVGKAVYSQRFVSTGTQIQVVDLTDQPSGVYTLQLQSSNSGAITKRIIKQ